MYSGNAQSQSNFQSPDMRVFRDNCSAYLGMYFIISFFPFFYRGQNIDPEKHDVKRLFEFLAQTGSFSCE